MFARKIIALAAGAVMVAGGTVGALSANAATNAGVCTVTGSVTSSGINLTPSNSNTFTFNSVSINCTSSDAAANGAWTVNTVAGTTGSTNETCAGATSIRAGLTGSGPLGSLTGSLDSSTSARVGANVAVNGTINSGGRTFTFHGHLIFVPKDGVCAGGSGDTTHADINTGSTAAITEI